MALTITKVTTENVRIPLKVPKGIATKSYSYRDYTLFEIETAEGISGWSYVWGLPAVKAMADLYKDFILGEDACFISKIWNKLFSQMDRWDRSGVATRFLSGIDMALWDIVGKAAGMPIYKLFGPARDDIEVYYSGGYYPAEYKDRSELFTYLEKDIGDAMDRGFKSFKMRIGRSTPSIDVERVAMVRGLIGPDAKLMLDANCGYDPNVIVGIARKLEPYDLTWLEEPVGVDDFAGCQYLAERTSIPIALGENHFGLWQFAEIIEKKCARIIQADPTVMGGFTEYKRLSGLCAANGLSMAPHCFHDISVQMGLAIPEVSIMEYMDLEGDVINIQAIIENPVQAVNGRITAHDSPGHGLILDRKAVERYKL